jgi:hypothetical protein
VSLGPTLVFDKSALECLSVDESVWLDTFFICNVTPLFFVETLADLEKAFDDGRSPEDVVGNLAEKLPENGEPNAHHRWMCRAELMGAKVAMVGSIVVARGQEKRVDGKRAVVVEEALEMAALRRWRRHQFSERDRAIAVEWRRQLELADLNAVYQAGREAVERIGRERRPRDLPQVRSLALELLRKPYSRHTQEGLARIVGPKHERSLIDAWRSQGGRPVHTFAPYTAHVLTVDLFFKLGLGADLIPRDRASNIVDLAYLYYLPFCMVFVSKDRLHRRMVEPFLAENQRFVWGEDLKADLHRIDAHYSALPQEMKERGIITFARTPPREVSTVVWGLWDELLGRPKDGDEAGTAAQAGPTPGTAEAHKRLLAEVNRIMEATSQGPAGNVRPEDIDAMVMQRQHRLRKGKWQLLPPEVARRS